MTITKKLSTLLIAAFCVMPHTLAQNAGKGGESATVRIEVERLPDLKPLVQAINFLLSTASLPLWVVIVRTSSPLPRPNISRMANGTC